MTTKFDFDNTSIFLHFDIACIDGELADELESYLWANAIGEKNKEDSLYVGLEDRGWSVSVVRYETHAKNVNQKYLKDVHDDIYKCFDAWVESMGGIENVTA